MQQGKNAHYRFDSGLWPTVHKRMVPNLAASPLFTATLGSKLDPMAHATQAWCSLCQMPKPTFFWHLISSQHLDL